MTLHDAVMTMARYGVAIPELEPGQLRQMWLQLARRYHTRGGCLEDQKAMAEINAAYDTLRREAMAALSVASKDPRRQGVCIWAWAGHTGRSVPSDHIARNDDSDPNYVKRRLWKLSGGSTEEWTIWPFDGRRFLPALTVYGSWRLHGEMARAALSFGRSGFRSPRAIFVQKHADNWGQLYLVYAHGVFTDAVLFQHQGGASPALDPVFVANLPSRLEAYRRLD